MNKCIVIQSFNATEELEQASLYPNIRVFTAAEKTADEVQADLIGIQESWSVASKGKCYVTSLSEINKIKVSETSNSLRVDLR